MGGGSGGTRTTCMTQKRVMEVRRVAQPNDCGPRMTEYQSNEKIPKYVFSGPVLVVSLK